MQVIDSSGNSRSTVVNTALIQGNLLINGGGDVFQRQVPGTATARTDATFGPDRWIVLTQTAAVNCERSTGDTKSKYAIKLTQNQASAQRLGLVQIVESHQAQAQRSRSTRFQGKVKISNSQAVRFAVLEWTGTADTSVTRDIVNDWTSSDYTDGASKFFVDTSITPLGNTSLTPSAATWTDFSLSVTPSASCNNLYVFAWTEGTAAQNVTFELTELQLVDGALSRDWLPRAPQAELSPCFRYCFNFTSGTNFGHDDNAHVGLGYAVSTTTAVIEVCLPTEMRVVPTLTITASDWKLHDGTNSFDATSCTISSQANKRLAVLLPVASGLTANRPYHMLADGTANRIALLDAEI